jgi:hypothetical protein
MDLANLKARALFAQHHGYEVARVDDYLAELGDPAAPEGVVAGSVEHLLAALGAAERGTPVKGAPKAPKPALVPAKAPEAPKPTEEPIEEPIEVEDDDHGKKGKRGKRG